MQLPKATIKFEFKFIYVKLAGLSLLLFLFSNCHSRKKTKSSHPPVQEVVVIDTSYERCKMDFKNGKTISKFMKENELNFSTLSGRLSCKMNNESDDENTFHVSIRCRKDSAIWMNISKMNVDAVRFLMTKDSVKFMVMTNLGGLEKGFFRGDFTYINESLNTDLDYDMMQALLVGNSADFLNDSIKMKGGKDKNNCLYFLSTLRKRKLNKLMDGQTNYESVQTIWLNPTSWKITMLEFNEANTNRKFNACFDNFQPTANNLMPLKMLYTITAEKTVTAEITWSKVTVNEPISMPYKVQPSYPEIKMKEKNNSTPGK
jgi:hypothetical protein